MDKSHDNPIAEAELKKLGSNDDTYAIVLPVGHGKTYLSKKNSKFVDVDSLYDNNDSKLNTMRNTALKTNKWDDYQKYFHVLLRAGFDKGNYKDKIILLHSDSDAKALGLTVMARVMLKDFEVVKKKLKDNKMASKVKVAKSNWDDLSNSGTNVIKVDTYDEIEKVINEAVS